jgi:hypothetical protein
MYHFKSLKRTFMLFKHEIFSVFSSVVEPELEPEP